MLRISNVNVRTKQFHGCQIIQSPVSQWQSDCVSADFTMIVLSCQAMPDLPSVERDGREPGAADDVPQPAEDAHAFAR